jgi:hypothetical protein
MENLRLSLNSRSLLATLVVLPVLATLVTLAFAQSPVPAKPEVPQPLKESERLQIREVQLSLAQAHIARLQAEAQVYSLESQLARIVESLKVAYSCRDCTLQSDFTWQKPAPPKAPDPEKATTPATTSPAPKKGGQTSNKE